jgi:hypothetical protein
MLQVSIEFIQPSIFLTPVSVDIVVSMPPTGAGIRSFFPLQHQTDRKLRIWPMVGGTSGLD